MKKKMLSVILIPGLCYLCLQSNSAGVATVGGINATASPAGCSCHNVSTTTAITTSLQLLNGTVPVTTYIPGHSYTIRLTGTNTSTSSLPRFGYQLTAVKTTGSGNAGTLTVPSGSHTQVISGVTVVEQSSALSPASGTGGSGTQYVVNIPWTAPVAGTGNVTIRSVLNAVNNNANSDAGDKWNSASLTVTEAISPSLVGTASENVFSVYPNPARGSFSLKLPQLNEPVDVYITNVEGQLMRLYSVDKNSANISPGLPAGLYNVSVHTSAINYFSRLVIEE